MATLGFGAGCGAGSSFTACRHSFQTRPPSGGSGGAGGAGGPGEVTVVVNQLAASKAGSSTYQVGVEFDERRVKDVYALFGQPGDPLIIPPAYQAPVPCGSNVEKRRCAGGTPTVPISCSSSAVYY